MDTQNLAEAVLDPGDVPADRLYRIAPDVYQGMVRLGLTSEKNGVSLEDGLLMTHAEDGAEADPSDRLYRFPLGVYHAMVEHGLLGPDDRAELLDGLLVKKMGKGPPHMTGLILTVDALRGIVPQGYSVRFEGPVTLPSGPSGHASEPEPDVSVVRGGVREYSARHPDPQDTALAVEVADSSLRDDRLKKLVRYAWAGIPVAWIVNLVDRTVEVYSRPTGAASPARYQEVAVYGEGDDVPVVVDGREAGRLAARDLLP